jgi:hypothetical protein
LQPTFELVDLSTTDFLEEMSTNTQSFVYHTQRVLASEPAPQRNTALGFVHEHGVLMRDKARLNVWMGSANTTAAVHYDHEHNVFLQLQGEKSFLILEPTAALQLRLFSSLHPRWRHAEELSDEEVEKLQARTWRVTLHPGTLLVLPPFFLHQVTTHSASVSVNVWSASKEQAVMEELRLLRTPFARDVELLSKLRATATLLRHVAQVLVQSIDDRFVTVDSLVQTLHFRAGLTELKACEDITEWSRCCYWLGEHDTNESDGGRKALQAAASIAQTLQSAPQQHARMLLLLDYVEELLTVVLQNEATPCALGRFTESCCTTACNASSLK